MLRGLIAFALCLSIVQAGLPIKPAMVCLAADGHILDFCPPGGHRPAPHACCKPASQDGTSACLVSKGVRCGFVSVSKSLPAATKSPVGPSFEMPWLAPAPQPEMTQELLYGGERIIAGFHDPPPTAPHSPDLSRAPPLA